MFFVSRFPKPTSALKPVKKESFNKGSLMLLGSKKTGDTKQAMLDLIKSFFILASNDA